MITLGVGLHSNEEENFLNRIVKSELNKIDQGRHRNSARNTVEVLHHFEARPVGSNC